MDTSDDEEMEEPEYDDGDSFSTKTHLPNFVMRDSLLKNFITDPHQHILYEYDFMNPKIFYLELQKTLQTDDASGFPRCTYKCMELPKEVMINTANLEDPELEDEDLEEEDDDLFGEEGFNDEDFGDLNEYSDF